jgi:hypothetical protein
MAATVTRAVGARERQQPRRKEKAMPRVSLNLAAPEFGLADFSGRTVRLYDYRGRKNVLLVFNRGFT